MHARCPSVEGLSGDFVSGWVCVKHPRSATAEAITGTRRERKRERERQLAYNCLEHFPETDSPLKSVLDLNWGGKNMMNRF